MSGPWGSVFPSPVPGAGISAVAANVLATAETAAAGNAATAPAWNAPPLWTASTVYQIGAVVRGPTGDDQLNIYQLHSGTSAINAAGTSGTTGPTGRAAAQVDGTCVWQYIGRVSDESATLPTHLNFTAAPASGATSATLASAWAGPTGTYTVTFTNGNRRSVTLTSGETTATWSTGLSAAALVLATVRNPSAPGFAIVGISTATLDSEGISKAYGPWTLVSQIPEMERHGVWSCVLGGLAASPTVVDALGPPGGVAGSARTQNGLYNSVLVSTDADELVVHNAGSGWSVSSGGLNVEVNGRLVYYGSNYRPQSSISAPLALRIDLSCFPPNEERRVRIYFRQIINGVSSLRTAPRFNVWAPYNGRRWKLAIEGDSLNSGGNTVPSFQGQHWAAAFANRVGCDHYYNNAVGGTGWDTPGTGRTTYAQRLSELLTFQPDVVFVASCHNGTGAQAAQAASVVAYVNSVLAALPNALVIIGGTAQMLHGENTTSGVVFDNEVAVMSAAANFAGNPRVRFIPTLTAAVPWFSGAANANAASPAGGTGDRFFWVSGALTDGHPMWVGYDYSAQRYADAVVAALRASAAA